ncbi:thiamine biosynthesis protein ThiF [compost metagenome]
MDQFTKYSHLTRQLDVLPVDRLNHPIHIIGVGAIGSLVALNLAKMGLTNQVVYDFDTVSVENMSCQFYRHKDIGKSKVHALHELIKDFTNEEIIPVESRWTPDPSRISGTVVIAVDDMEARKSISEDLRSHINVSHFIDTRMGLEDAALYVMNPHDEKDRETYGKTLYSNQEAVQERCTAKATIYTASMLAGFAAKAVKNLVCGEAYPRVSLWSVQNNSLSSWVRI